MASVTFRLADHSLSREEKAVVFRAHNEGGKIGELKISKGGLRWYPRSARKHHFMTWERFAALIKEATRKVA